MEKYCVCIKKEKSYWKIEDRRPGELMLLHNINNNIPIYHPSYPGVYQYEYEKLEIYSDIVFGVGTKQKKTVETAVKVTHAIFNIWKKNPIAFLKGGWMQWGY